MSRVAQMGRESHFLSACQMLRVVQTTELGAGERALILESSKKGIHSLG
jgi:hypothetical protein